MCWMWFFNFLNVPTIPFLQMCDVVSNPASTWGADKMLHSLSCKYSHIDTILIYLVLSYLKDHYFATLLNIGTILSTLENMQWWSVTEMIIWLYVDCNIDLQCRILHMQYLMNVMTWILSFSFLFIDFSNKSGTCQVN